MGAPYLLQNKITEEDVDSTSNTSPKNGPETQHIVSSLYSRKESISEAQSSQPQWDTLIQNKTFRYLKQNRSMVKRPAIAAQKNPTATQPIQSQHMIKSLNAGSKISQKKRSIDQTIEAIQNKLNRNKAAKMKQHGGCTSMLKMHQQLFHVNNSSMVQQEMDNVLDEGVRGFSPQEMASSLHRGNSQLQMTQRG